MYLQSQSMVVQEGSGQNADLQHPWINHHGRLKEAFTHMRYAPPSDLKAVRTKSYLKAIIEF